MSVVNIAVIDAYHLIQVQGIYYTYPAVVRLERIPGQANIRMQVHINATWSLGIKHGRLLTNSHQRAYQTACFPSRLAVDFRSVALGFCERESSFLYLQWCRGFFKPLLNPPLRMSTVMPGAERLFWWTADLGCRRHHVLVVYVKNDGCFRRSHDRYSHWE